MQSVHVLPAAAFAILVTKQSQPSDDIKIACATRCGIGHDDLAFVLGLGKVFPSLRL